MRRHDRPDSACRDTARRDTALACAVTTLALLAAPTLAAREAARQPLHATYREPAARLIGASLLSEHAYDTLAHLSDHYGPRLSGSERLEKAIDWAIERMRSDGLKNVRREMVMVPVWVRGEESATLTAPVTQRLNILGLGGSVATPAGGIEAEVVVVGDFDQLDALGEAGVKGRIVLYDVPFTSYGETVKYRGSGPSRAAALGAVAVLVRSVGPVSWDTPHTGALRYTDEDPKIPAAAVTVENATLMRRIFDRGDTLRVRLEMAARTLEDRPSANVVGEVVGREKPEEIVVVGGHIDTWDVGQGAQDDGAGCVIAWEAARLIHTLGLEPRRTIRVVLYTNEENGLRGGKAYAADHAAELDNHVAAIESDSGNGLADGFRVHVPPKAKHGASDEEKATLEKIQAQLSPPALAIMAEIAPLLEPLNATSMAPGYSGADIGPLVEGGVPGLGLNHDTTKYWWIHHTHADTMDKIIKKDLDINVAIMAVMTYVLADMPGRLVEPSALTAADETGLVTH